MDVCCGIVLFNPSLDRLKENINAIEKQVQVVVLVDNGSQNIQDVKTIADNNKKINLIVNSENKGIAYALNQILKYAKEKNMHWTLTLDQDSVCDSNIIESYTNYILSTVGIITPRIMDINMPNDNSKEDNCEEIVDSTKAITSGSLIQVEAWEKVGRFDDRLFIDYVDTDFQERILRCGYKILKVNNTFILHEVGKMRIINFCGIKIYCSNHSATRRYYSVRNRLYFQKKYFGWKGYIVERFRLILGDLKILLFEDDKINKVKASFRGYLDYRKLLN